MQIFVQKRIVLHENASLLVFRQIHLVADLLPLLRFIRSHVKFCDLVSRNLFEALQRVAQCPLAQVVGIPVVIDVVLVLVGTGDAVEHITSLILGIMHSPCPEAGELHQRIDTILTQIAFVAGIVGVVIDGVGNGAVAVDLLKGNLPLVVTLHAGEGDHGIERAGQALLPRVMLRTI